MTSPVLRSQKKTKHTVHVSPTYLATGPFFFGKPITVPWNTGNKSKLFHLACGVRLTVDLTKVPLSIPVLLPMIFSLC